MADGAKADIERGREREGESLCRGGIAVRRTRREWILLFSWVMLVPAWTPYSEAAHLQDTPRTSRLLRSVRCRRPFAMLLDQSASWHCKITWSSTATGSELHPPHIARMTSHHICACNLTASKSSRTWSHWRLVCMP